MITFFRQRVIYKNTVRDKEYKNILKTVVWCYLIFFLHSPSAANSTNSILVRFLSHFSSTRGTTETLTMSQKAKWVNTERKKSRSSKLWCTNAWANAFTVDPSNICKRTQASLAATTVVSYASSMPPKS